MRTLINPATGTPVAEELTRLEVEDTGKPAAMSRGGEPPFAVDHLRFFAGAARSPLDGPGFFYPPTPAPAARDSFRPA
ncbi:MAG TPA: hypothetical protein VNW94_25530 [Streptosporangiaceae bacterium]|nr:hypothetical protein [Streptosporangiaceae bacterium]